MDQKLSTTRCAVPCCNSGRSVKKHMFPKNDVLGPLWVKAVNHPLLSSLTYEDIRKKNYWICFKHFSAESTHFAGRTSLSKDAVPSLCLPIRDDSIVVEKDVSIRTEICDDTERNFASIIASDLFDSLHYTRSPATCDIRKSGLKTPDSSPVKSQLHLRKKRQLFPAVEYENSAPLKKFKYTIVDDSGLCDVPMEVSLSIDSQSSSQSAVFEESSSNLPHLSSLGNSEVPIQVSLSTESNTLPKSAGFAESPSNLPHSPSYTISTVVESTIMMPRTEDADRLKTFTPKTYSSISSNGKTSRSISFSSTSTFNPERSKTVIAARVKRRRILSTNSLNGIDITPKGARVISETLNIHKELMRNKKHLRRKSIRNALKDKCLVLCKNFKHLSSTQQAIVDMQLRNALKDANGRRFSDEEKTLALSIYKQSPSAYRFLTQLLILPSVSTVKRNLSKIELDTGINSNISKLLEECASGMKNEMDKVVLLMWDETHLKNEIHYDYKKDKVIGFEDFGNRRTSKFANEILIFMIRGLYSNTKLPISYYFSNSQTKYGDLLHCVNENLEMLQKAGFHVVATVCDAGSSNVRVYEHLRVEYESECHRNNIEPDPMEKIIYFNGEKICLLHDTSHMFKSERNLLLNHMVELGYKDADPKNPSQGGFVKWEHYETAFDMDINSGICERHIPKITEIHVRKERIKRMKVLHVCQVFSRSMAKWLQTCVLIKDVTTTEGTFTMEKNALNTAEFTLFQDTLFDSLNSRKTKQRANELRKPMQQVVTDESPHWVLWKEAIKKFQNMRFRTEKKLNPALANKTRHRFIAHLKTMPDLWKSVKEKGFTHLKMGYVNQDPLENFFGRLKAYGVRNVSPSPFQAEAQLKSLMVSDLSSKNSIGANCLDDEGTIMATLNTLASDNSNIEKYGNRSHELDQAALPVDKKNVKWTNLTVAKRILSAGHFCKIILSKINGISKCQTCVEAFLSNKENDNVGILKSAHVENKGIVASADYFERGYSRGVRIVEKKLASIGFKANLRQSLLEELKVLDFEWIKCNDHRKLIKDCFKENLVLHCINNWIIHMTHILTGKTKIKGGNLMELEAARQYSAGLKRKNGMEKYRNPLPPELLKGKKERSETLQQQEEAEVQEELYN